jgi:hypothetical protein
MKRETPQQLDAIALQVRRRVLRWFAHRGLLDGDAARDMLLWAKPGAAPTPPAYPPGGFSPRPRADRRVGTRGSVPCWTGTRWRSLSPSSSSIRASIGRRCRHRRVFDRDDANLADFYLTPREHQERHFA